MMYGQTLLRRPSSRTSAGPHSLSLPSTTTARSSRPRPSLGPRSPPSLHIRRGDYEGHCEHLARCSSSFLAFNALPQLDPLSGGAWGENTHENLAIYRKHCYPAVTRVREVQQTEHAQGLESAYIMTNGAVPWVGRGSSRPRFGTRAALRTSRVAGTSGAEVRRTQAVDMLVATGCVPSCHLSVWWTVG